MKITNPLTPDEIATGPDGAVAKKHGLHLHTPLWYYILKEAEQRGSGERLGPVGATIVSEVFVGLVHGDTQSYLWQKGKNWKPDAAVEDARRLHHGRLAALRRRHQPDRRHLGSAANMMRYLRCVAWIYRSCTIRLRRSLRVLRS